MSKAEDLAKELYPDWKITGFSTVDGQERSMVRIQRVAYTKGYHQAEKDNELTWEDMSFIRLVFDAIEADIYLGAIKIQPMTKEYYQEVLKQFKKIKYGSKE